MVCIYCGHDTLVTNSRHLRRSNQVWRRRKCTACHALFTTTEVAQYQAAWTVRQADGHIMPFSRDKLLLSIYKSCEHRPAALQDAGALAGTVMNKLLSSRPENGIIGSQTIVHTVQVALNRFDKVASVHYAAFHRAT